MSGREEERAAVVAFMAERSAIVAWLRSCELSAAIPNDPAQIVADIAEAIEMGVHHG